jgi:RimJ/RimL family protein N-acetyltransferase
MTDTVIATSRLLLRRWRGDDLQPWLEHLNTPQVKQYLGGMQAVEQAAERFALMRGEWDRTGYSFLAVELREDGRFLGTCGLAGVETAGAPVEMAGAIQIGWQLRADAWGNGFATEAARAMLGYAFAQLEPGMVFAQTSERNGPSWQVMKRLGMARRAELDYDDPDYPPEDNPTMVWSITREQWERAQ